MDKSTFIQLYEKYLAGNCTEAEKQWLEDYQDSFNITDNQWDEALMGNEKATRQAIWDQLQPKVSRKGNIRRIAVWAAAACTIGVAALLLYRPAQQARLLADDIQAGGNKATLVLGNGKTVALEQLASGVLREQDGVKINQQDGTIVFDPQTSATHTYNTVVTPKGGQYKVVLPDGSKVFLNSASTLSFPAVFSGEQREVTLTGEAYFEIAKKADKPFSVKLKHGEIKVLGTHFNVKAYDEEPVIKTTLLEGAVKVISESAGEVLKPGQQAVIKNNALSVEDVNADAAVAWTDGIFEFNGTDVKDVMQQLGRWYNVDIEYEQDIKGKTFTGQLPKTVNASVVLKIIEQTGGVHFKITNQKIIVQP